MVVVCLQTSFDRRARLPLTKQLKIKMVQCGRCDKKFKLEIALKKHIEKCKNVIKVASSQKRKQLHRCEICEKNLACMASLRSHIKHVHEESKKFECETCKKSFSQNVHLR